MSGSRTSSTVLKTLADNGRDRFPWARGHRTLAWWAPLVRYVTLVLTAADLLLPYRHGQLPMDLHVYVLGGRAALHGSNLYGPQVAVNGYPFTYPPFAALPFALMAALSNWAIIAVTAFVFYGALVVVLECCDPGLLRRVGDSWGSWLTVFVVLELVPVWATLRDGQVNLLLAALVVADLLSARRGRGALVGVAAAIKLTPAVFVLYLLATKQWSVARNAAVSYLACTGLAWLLLPADSNRFWFHTLFETSRIGDTARVSNQSLLGLASKEFTGKTTIHLVWLALAVTVTIVTLWTVRRLHAHGQEVLALGFVGVLGCLLSPISWTHHWVWVVPVLLGVLAAPARRSWPCRAATVIACLVFYWGASRQPPHLPVIHLIMGNLFVLVGLGAIAMAAWAARSLPQPTSASATTTSAKRLRSSRRNRVTSSSD